MLNVWKHCYFGGSRGHFVDVNDLVVACEYYLMVVYICDNTFIFVCL